MAAALELTAVTKSFKAGTPILKGIDLQIAEGEMVALIGASGSGKSTLIRCVAGLVPIDRGAGSISVLGETMQAKGRVTRAAKSLRSRVGIVFQQFNLVPRLSVLTNVCLGFLGKISAVRGTLGRFSSDEKKRAFQALSRVGIGDHVLKRGSELSGGQQQRAAIARSLVQGAEVLIADEPIASLDPSSARRVMDILSNLNRQDGITVLVSLHQVEYALNYCPRTVALREGEVVYDGPSKALTPAFLGELYGAESEELFLPGIANEEPATSSMAEPAPAPAYQQPAAVSAPTNSREIAASLAS
ncbi:MAG: phosphonate ABC transporter ATP-binding protein [Pseudomonadota bacterium]